MNICPIKMPLWYLSRKNGIIEKCLNVTAVAAAAEILINLSCILIWTGEMEPADICQEIYVQYMMNAHCSAGLMNAMNYSSERT